MRQYCMMCELVIGHDEPRRDVVSGRIHMVIHEDCRVKATDEHWRIVEVRVSALQTAALLYGSKT